MNSKEQQIRQWYVNKKEYATNFAPSIVTDDYWEYCLDKPYYTHFFEGYNFFRDGLKNVYNDDFDAFLTDWGAALQKLTTLHKKVSAITRRYNVGAPPITLSEFKDGLYVSLDVKKALIQSSIKEGVYTKEEYMACFSGCKSSDFFASLKLLYCSANHLHFLWGEYPSLAVDFPQDNPYGMVARLPIGDNVMILPYNMDDFRDKIDGIIRLQSGYIYHVEWVKKTTVDSPLGQISALIHLNKEMKPQHINAYVNNRKSLAAEFFPQLYKKLYNLPLEKFDLAFGTGDKIGFFPKPIFD